MNQILYGFSVSKYITTKYWIKGHWFKANEEGYNSDVISSDNMLKNAVLTKEIDSDGTIGWAIRFDTKEVTEEWIEKECRKQKQAATGKKALRYASATAYAAAAITGEVLKGGGGSTAATSKSIAEKYQAAGNGGLDEPSIRTKCITYLCTDGTKKLLYSPWSLYNMGSFRSASWNGECPKEVELGKKSPLCTENVDESKCITFFYEVDKNSYLQHTESITIEFQSDATANAVYAHIAKLI